MGSSLKKKRRNGRPFSPLAIYPSFDMASRVVGLSTERMSLTTGIISIMDFASRPGTDVEPM